MVMALMFLSRLTAKTATPSNSLDFDGTHVGVAVRLRGRFERAKGEAELKNFRTIVVLLLQEASPFV